MSERERAPAADRAPEEESCAPEAADGAPAATADEKEYERYLAKTRGRPRMHFGVKFIRTMEAHWTANGRKAFDALLKRHPRDYVRIMGSLIPTEAMAKAFTSAPERAIEVIDELGGVPAAAASGPAEAAVPPAETEPDPCEEADTAAAAGSGPVPERDAGGRYGPGSSGNPLGRPRARFGVRFVAAAARHWAQNGTAALDRLLDQHPRDYVRAMAALVPPDAMLEMIEDLPPIRIVFQAAAPAARITEPAAAAA